MKINREEHEAHRPGAICRNRAKTSPAGMGFDSPALKRAMRCALSASHAASHPFFQVEPDMVAGFWKARRTRKIEPLARLLPVGFNITSTSSRAFHKCKCFLHGNHHYHRRRIKICGSERLLLPLLNCLKEFRGEFLSSGYLLSRHLLFEHIPRFRRFGCTLCRR